MAPCIEIFRQNNGVSDVGVKNIEIVQLVKASRLVFGFHKKRVREYE